MNKQSKMSLSDLDIDFQKFCKKIKTAQQTTNLDSTAANQDSLFILLLVPSRFVAVLSRFVAVRSQFLTVQCEISGLICQP